MQANDHLLRRLDRLERDNRRWRWGSLALCAGLLGILAVGFACPTVAPAPENVVSAERFVLVGPGGEEYAVLGLDDHGFPNLLLHKDQAHAFLTVAGPALSMRGADGKTGAFLGLDPKGSSRLELSSANPQDGIRAAVQTDGSSGIYVVDSSGRERAGLEHLATGASQLTARDAKGNIRAVLGHDAEGAVSSLLLDELGRRRIGMIVAPDGTPTLATEDEQGRLRSQLTMDRDGLPLLQLLREDGQPMFQQPK